MNNRPTRWFDVLAAVAAVAVAILATVACQPEADRPVPAPTFAACEGPEDYPAPYSLPCQRTSNGLTTVFVGWERECPPLPTGPGLWECVGVYDQDKAGVGD